MKRRTLLCSAAGLVAVTTVGCTEKAPDNTPTITPVPVAPQPLLLRADGLPDQFSIGVVVSLSSLPGEGSDWLLAAEGVQVAAERFRLGGHDLQAIAVDDQGSAAGAVEAVAKLADEGVAGIILATTGSHTPQAIAEAAARQVPLVMPYLVEDDHLVEGTWATGPLRSTYDAAVVQALTELGSQQLIQITGMGAPVPEGVEPAASLTFNLSNQTEAAFIEDLTALALEGADGVLVVGDADSSSQAATAVRRAGLRLPIVVTDAARSPVFASQMLADTGSLNGTYWCAGLANDDPASVRQDETGRAMTAFLEAVQHTARDQEVTRYFEDAPFADVAFAADAASHDAAVALVLAAAKAKSADPTAVLTALRTLQLTHEHGLVGPSLDFSTPAAVPDGAVVPLVATTNFAASRPGNRPMMRWFEAAKDS